MMRAPLILALLLVGGARAAGPVYDRALEARVFDRAWSLVDRHYWDRAHTGSAWEEARDRFRDRALAAPDRRAFYTILGEMLAALGDSHVFAIDPVQVAIGKARDAGHAEQGFGLGIVPDDDGRWMVRAVRPGSPAARAGVAIGWEVRAVDGRPFDIDYQPGAGEQAVFAFADEQGTLRSLPLTAELEQAPPVRRATRLPGGVLLMGLDGFDPGADRWLARQIAADPAPRAIILDLRGNDGGDAEVIARVAGLFYAADRPLVRRIAARETVQRTRGAGPRSWLGPLAVLVGPDSASGAEALAALIEESGRAPVIGARTAGALTGATLYRLPDGGQLSVAEFDIRTPAGRRLEGVGLDPDVALAPTLADRRAGRDPVLERARRLLAAEAER